MFAVIIVASLIPFVYGVPDTINPDGKCSQIPTLYDSIFFNNQQRCYICPGSTCGNNIGDANSAPMCSRLDSPTIDATAKSAVFAKCFGSTGGNQCDRGADPPQYTEWDNFIVDCAADMNTCPLCVSKADGCPNGFDSTPFFAVAGDPYGGFCYIAGCKDDSNGGFERDFLSFQYQAGSPSNSVSSVAANYIIKRCAMMIANCPNPVHWVFNGCGCPECYVPTTAAPDTTTTATHSVTTTASNGGSHTTKSNGGDTTAAATHAVTTTAPDTTQGHTYTTSSNGGSHTTASNGGGTTKDSTHSTAATNADTTAANQCYPCFAPADQCNEGGSGGTSSSKCKFCRCDSTGAMQCEFYSTTMTTDAIMTLREYCRIDMTQCTDADLVYDSVYPVDGGNGPYCRCPRCPDTTTAPDTTQSHTYTTASNGGDTTAAATHAGTTQHEYTTAATDAHHVSTTRDSTVTTKATDADTTTVVTHTDTTAATTTRVTHTDHCQGIYYCFGTKCGNNAGTDTCKKCECDPNTGTWDCTVDIDENMADYFLANSGGNYHCSNYMYPLQNDCPQYADWTWPSVPDNTNGHYDCCPYCRYTTTSEPDTTASTTRDSNHGTTEDTATKTTETKTDTTRTDGATTTEKSDTTTTGTSDDKTTTRKPDDASTTARTDDTTTTETKTDTTRTDGATTTERSDTTTTGRTDDTTTTRKSDDASTTARTDDTTTTRGGDGSATTTETKTDTTRNDGATTTEKSDTATTGRTDDATTTRGGDGSVTATETKTDDTSTTNREDTISTKASSDTTDDGTATTERSDVATTEKTDGTTTTDVIATDGDYCESEGSGWTDSEHCRFDNLLSKLGFFDSCKFCLCEKEDGLSGNGQYQYATRWCNLIENMANWGQDAQNTAASIVGKCCPELRGSDDNQCIFSHIRVKSDITECGCGALWCCSGTECDTPRGANNANTLRVFVVIGFIMSIFVTM